MTDTALRTRACAPLHRSANARLRKPGPGRAALFACTVLLWAAAAPLAWSQPAANPDQTAPAALDVKTRHALFKASRFDELPGWGQDSLDTAWDAFQASCKALAKRETWKPLCDKAAGLPRSPALWRQFFEQGFTLFRILNTDTSHDGEVTGYYEPLINGSPRAQGAFTVPVYGTPNDLFTLDWKTIAPAQRGGTVFVVKAGRGLSVVASAQADSYALDTAGFDLDTRDRNWRVQLVGAKALPYRSRAEIEAGAGLDAPVIAYVDDALALYAMQVQGSGRIRLPDGTQLRVQYAEQNGHPFKPLRLVSKAAQRGRTRNIDSALGDGESFELAGDSEVAPAGDADTAADGVRRRGLRTGETRPASSNAVTEALIEELLSQAQGKPQAAPTAPTRATASVVAPAQASGSAPAPTPGDALAPRSGAALINDPSYVFFRVAPDQSPTRGPVGALGVPLTAGRSIAVDPRVTPLGYPVYISAPSLAPTATGSALPLQRLVIAQDTGGAIRGAIRADFFWGSGHDAGRQALRTRQRGEMWLMMPHAEASQLRQRAVSTRLIGSALRVDSECLVADESFCSEPD